MIKATLPRFQIRAALHKLSWHLLRTIFLTLGISLSPTVFAAGFPGQGGTSFSPPTYYPLPESARFSTSGNLNNDGYSDMVLLTYRSGGEFSLPNAITGEAEPVATKDLLVHIYLSKGPSVPGALPNWETQPPINLTTPKMRADIGEERGDSAPYQTWERGGFAKIVDLNTDGYPDILILDPETGLLHILWNQQGNPAWKPTDPRFIYDPQNANIQHSISLKTSGYAGNVKAKGAPVAFAVAENLLSDSNAAPGILILHLGETWKESTSGKYIPFQSIQFIPGVKIGSFPGWFGDQYYQDPTNTKAETAGRETQFAYSATATGLPERTLPYPYVAGYTGGKTSLAFPPWKGIHPIITESPDFGAFAGADAIALPTGDPFLTKKNANGAPDDVYLRGADGNLFKLTIDASTHWVTAKKAYTLSKTGGHLHSAAATLAKTSVGESVLLTARGDQYYQPKTLNERTISETLPALYKQPCSLGSYFQVIPFSNGPALVSSYGYQQMSECKSMESFLKQGLDLTGTLLSPWNINVPVPPQNQLLLIEPLTEQMISGRPEFRHIHDPKLTQVTSLSIKRSNYHGLHVLPLQLGAAGEKALATLEPVWADPTNSQLVVRWEKPRVAGTPPRLIGILPETNYQVNDLITIQQIALGATNARIAIPEAEYRRAPIADILITQGGEIVKILPVDLNKTEAPGDGNAYLLISGLETLPAGTYGLIARTDGAQSVEQTFTIVTPTLLPTTTTLDKLSGDECAIMADASGTGLYPKKQSITLSSALASGSSVEALFRNVLDRTKTAKVSGSDVTLSADQKMIQTVIPSTLTDGNYQLFLRIGTDKIWQAVGQWKTLHPKHWKINRSSACQQQIPVINAQHPGFIDSTTLYLDSVLGSAGGEVPSGNFSLIGQRFDIDRLTRETADSFDRWASEPRIQSAVLQQGIQKIWVEYDPSNTDPVKEGVVYYRSLSEEKRQMVSFNFGNLSKKLVDGQPVSLTLYAASKNEVETQGAPPIATIPDWRTTKTGIAKNLTAPTIDSITKLGSATGELKNIVPGSVLQIKGKGLVFPGPDSQMLVISVEDEEKKVRNYVIGPFQRTEDWITRNNLSNDDTVSVLAVVRSAEDILERELIAPTSGKAEEKPVSNTLFTEGAPSIREVQGIPLKDGAGLQPSTVQAAATQTKSILDSINMGRLPTLLEEICAHTQACDLARNKAAELTAATAAAEAVTAAAAQAARAAAAASLEGAVLAGAVTALEVLLPVAFPTMVVNTTWSTFKAAATGKPLSTAAQLDVTALGQLGRKTVSSTSYPDDTLRRDKTHDTIWFVGAYHVHPDAKAILGQHDGFLKHVLFGVKNEGGFANIVQKAETRFLEHLNGKAISYFGFPCYPITRAILDADVNRAPGSSSGLGLLLARYSNSPTDPEALRDGVMHGGSNSCTLPLYLVPIFGENYKGPSLDINNFKVEVIDRLGIGYCSKGWPLGVCGLSKDNSRWLVLNQNGVSSITGEYACGGELVVDPALHFYQDFHEFPVDCYNRLARAAYYYDTLSKRYLPTSAWYISLHNEIVSEDWQYLMEYPKDTAFGLFVGSRHLQTPKLPEYIINPQGVYLRSE